MNRELMTVVQKCGNDRFEIKVVDGGIELRRNGATHFRDLTPAEVFEAVRRSQR